MFQTTSGNSSSQASPSTNQRNQKYVEGTVSQLARVLYGLHRNFGAQPSTAIFEAINTFGDDVDRGTILQAARCSAEALSRKQKALLSNAKSKTSMTVFEQAQQLKEASLDKLKDEMIASWKASQREGQDNTVSATFLDTYEQIRTYRLTLKDEVLTATYSPAEIDQAKERLQRIKQIESYGTRTQFRS
jgi:hypothetical protein